MSHRIPPPDVLAGQAVYTRRVLRLYDLGVLAFSCRLIWRCPKALMLANYNEHVGTRHLDLGVGTGYFLDHCRFPTPEPQVTLLDLNPTVLAVSAQRIARYRPVQVQADVLQPLPVPPSTYDSVGLNFLLHCVPGTWERKSVVFANAAAALRPGGRVFGSTILASDVPISRTARTLMNIYNAKGIFHNASDDLDGLVEQLTDHFCDVRIAVRGCVVLFSATAHPGTRANGARSGAGHAGSAI